MGPVAAAARVSCDVATSLVPLIEVIKDPWFSSEATRHISDNNYYCILSYMIRLLFGFDLQTCG
jgi:hypothetical protein